MLLEQQKTFVSIQKTHDLSWEYRVFLIAVLLKLVIVKFPLVVNTSSLNVCCIILRTWSNTICHMTIWA